ncbi:MAG TPA: hypothetical protein VHV76_13770 [Mycobacteriales bacterium]|nr:hypothetical protein [Mycobacteriales bacterium]
MRLGIADHLGWAIAVIAAPDGAVVDRRRVELIAPGLPAAPVHHEGGAHLMHRVGQPLTDAALASLVVTVRASIVTSTSLALDELASAAGAPIDSISLRTWPAEFPSDIATQRRAPYEARADAIMYRQVLAELGHARGWRIHQYDAKRVEAEAVGLVGEGGEGILHRPRAVLGAPWSKDHRVALAAAIVAP